MNKVNLACLFNVEYFSLQEQRTQLEEILSCRIESLLCVPVISRVNQEVMAIACMVNKNQATQ